MLPHLRAFELLLAPYAIAHLKLAMQVGPKAATEAASSILLTDTLEWPGDAPRLEDFDPVAAEGQRAGEVKDAGRPTVIIGNPPYGRVARAHTGGWVANADGPRPALMDDWIARANRDVIFAAVASLYDRYVYFWRWSMWKAFEQPGDVPGVVAFITGAGWLDGPAFGGVREAARSLCSEVWIVDLGGDSRGASPEANIFDIQTPVAIAVLVRAEPERTEPARIRYRRVRGTRREKLAAAVALRGPEAHEDAWQDLPSLDGAVFRPTVGGATWTAMPALTDLLPWQQPGAMLNRTWPVAPDSDTLAARWAEFLADDDRDRRAELFPDPRTGRTITTFVGGRRPLVDVPPGTAAERASGYQWRPFDRQLIIADPRLAALERPALWQTLSSCQLFLVALAGEGGLGPTVQVSTVVPDKHAFHGRGGKDILPLYRDAAAACPNVTAGLLDVIGVAHRLEEPGTSGPDPESLAAYLFALLSTPGYQARFASELADRVKRVPITADPGLWAEAVALGEELLWLQTFCERFGAGRPVGFPSDRISVERPVTQLPEDTSELVYDEDTSTLSVADGRIAGVAPEVWAFSVSGWPVVPRWLEHRTAKGRGKRSSELDQIRPDRWHPEWTDELLEVLRALDGSIRLQPQQDDLLARILDGPLIPASELPTPTDAERKVPPTIKRASQDKLL